MGAKLTSVRLDDSMLEKLRLLASVNETNIAAEIREAVRLHLQANVEAPTFRTRLKEMQDRQSAIVDSLGGVDQDADRPR